MTHEFPTMQDVSSALEIMEVEEECKIIQNENPEENENNCSQIIHQNLPEQQPLIENSTAFSDPPPDASMPSQDSAMDQPLEVLPQKESITVQQQSHVQYQDDIPGKDVVAPVMAQEREMERSNNVSDKKDHGWNNSDSLQNQNYGQPQTWHPSIRWGLPNIGNTCFANAVIQCLYHTLDFKDLLYDAEQFQRNRLLSGLAGIFRWIDTKGKSKGNYVEKELKSFISEVSRYSPDIRLGSFGDPNTLFTTIFNQLPEVLQDFYTGTIQTKYICHDCIADKDYFTSGEILTTNHVLPSFDVNRKFYKESYMPDLFQQKEDYAYCLNCKQEGHQFLRTFFSKPPHILVINLEDNLRNDRGKIPQLLLQDITVKLNKKSYVNYQFFTCVATSSVGSCGVHAVTIIADEEYPGSGYLLNDNSPIRQIDLDNIGYYPRLLFYKNCT